MSVFTDTTNHENGGIVFRVTPLVAGTEDWIPASAGMTVYAGMGVALKGGFQTRPYECRFVEAYSRTIDCGEG